MKKVQPSLSFFKIGFVTVLAVCGFAAYDYYFVQRVSAIDAVAPLAGGADPQMAIIDKLDSIHLDASLFSDPAFVSLKDFTIEIPLQPVGKPNPFAPLGSSQTTKTTKKTTAKPATSQ